jgi:hypothetical protein
MVTAALLVLAAAEEHASKTAFYVAGGLLVAFALVISAVGTMGAETFPSSRGVRTGVCLLAGLLVAAAMATAVLTS